MLTIQDAAAGYGELQVLSDITITVEENEIVSLIGANGAGKTTLMKALMGLIPCREGSIQFRGEEMNSLSTPDRVRRGLVLIPEGRGILTELTVRENLLMGGFHRQDQDAVREDIERFYDRFPILKERSNNPAGQLSGGEQQMLAISRGLLSRPELLMLDEPSMGLAPMIVQQVMDLLEDLHDDGMTIFLAEQNAVKALELSHRAYVLENGRIVHHGSPDELRNQTEIAESYLG